MAIALYPIKIIIHEHIVTAVLTLRIGNEFLNSDYLEQEKNVIFILIILRSIRIRKLKLMLNKITWVTRAFILILACCMNLVETCAQALKP